MTRFFLYVACCFNLSVSLGKAEGFESGDLLADIKLIKAQMQTPAQAVRRAAIVATFIGLAGAGGGGYWHFARKRIGYFPVSTVWTESLLSHGMLLVLIGATTYWIFSDDPEADSHWYKLFREPSEHILRKAQGDFELAQFIKHMASRLRSVQP